MKPTLATVTNNDETIPLDRLPVVLGRNAEAGIRLPDRFVSQFHCEISERNGVLFVVDLGSKHGCRVNGNIVAESPLMAGDRLSVGLTTFIVHYENLEGRLHEQSELQLTT